MQCDDGSSSEQRRPPGIRCCDDSFFPFPEISTTHCVALLEALEIGGASEADCRLDSLDSAWPVLNRLVCTKVTIDELDYLAKRLDSFTVGEFSQFQAMAEKLNLASMKDLINLTFCCQQATVITDFTNLKGGWP